MAFLFNIYIEQKSQEEAANVSVVDHGRCKNSLACYAHSVRQLTLCLYTYDFNLYTCTYSCQWVSALYMYTMTKCHGSRTIVL